MERDGMRSESDGVGKLVLEMLGMADVNSAGLRYEQAAQLEECPVRAPALGRGALPVA